MPRTRLPRTGALVIGAVLALTALGVGSLVLGSQPEPAPVIVEPEPEPQPEPDPPPPVEGTVELAEVIDLSAAGTQLYGSTMPEDQPVPFDDPAIDAFAAAVGAWLDDHLTDLQLGGPGLAGGPELVGAGDVVRLVEPDRLAVRATYVLVVGARGEPEWAETEVRVELEGGTSTSARLVFVAENGARLVAAHEAGPSEATTP